MPIYAYKCESCGFAKDVLQKMSDATLQDCPACSQPTFKKQLTAAGFQLKGSGWYATDFKGSGNAPAAAPAADAPASAASDKAAPAEAKVEGKSESTPAPAPAKPAAPAASASES